MAKVSQIILCGLEEQGIVLAGTILGYAGINDKKWVAGPSVHGAYARGRDTQAEVIISDKPIIFPRVIKADILIAMSQSVYDKYIRNVDENGIVIYDEQTVSIKAINGLKQTGIPATDIAVKELNNKQVANMIILGMAVGITQIVTEGALISAIEENISERCKALNLEAVKRGFKLGKEAISNCR